MTQKREWHGMKKTRAYGIWCGMKTRCLNENFRYYKYYGGRGITVCDRWLQSFMAFYEDMGEPPEGTSLERKNNDLGYSPDNCVWAGKKEQARNRRGRRMLTVNGETKSMAEWAEANGISIRTMWARCNTGWSDADAATTPVGAMGYGTASKRHATAAARGVTVYQDERATA